MAALIELRQSRQFALDKADAIMKAAESTHRQSTDAENADLEVCMTAVAALNAQIQQIESKNTMHKVFGANGMVLTSNGGRPSSKERMVLSEDYLLGFADYIASNGKRVSAAMYEGSNAAGGYAVPVVIDDQIVPLAPSELAVRQLASVIPTVSDIKLPTKTAFGTAALKTETNAFGGTAPTLGQFTLSAFMVGAQNDLSWELAQDVPVFQSFLVQDMILAQQILEETYYVTGSGSGQPQGFSGNVGLGTTEEPDSAGNLVSIAGTFDLLGKLNAVYHPNASWLMSRATGVIIRKAQAQANLFEPVWTRENGQDFLHGYPVKFSGSMPAAARGASPIIFGDFKMGYLIGDRGGSGINVKVLDQPKAAQGLITLLTYRRTDGRVRLAEALQSYTIAAS